MNNMRMPRIEKLTLNIGAGKDVNKLDKAMVLIKSLTGVEPYKTVTQKRIPSWSLRPGLPVGCKLTLRKDKAVDILKRLLEAKENKLQRSNFDLNGNISFGIHEYIDIPDLKYDPKIGVMGLQVCVTLERPGHRIKRRRMMRKKLPSKQVVTREDAMAFLKDNFGVTVGGES